VEYPRSVHLIRGNHEAADINALFGFRLECLERLGDEDGIWCAPRLNCGVPLLWSVLSGAC
jgi:protein phosphatase